MCLGAFAYVVKAESDLYAASLLREAPVSESHVLRAHELDYLIHHIFMWVQGIQIVVFTLA